MIEKPDAQYDIAVVGGGLSAAAMIYALINRLKSASTPRSPIRLIVFDKSADFWTGVPYGSLAEPDFFLIESLAGTDCKPFRGWLYKNIENIHEWMKNGNATLKAWYLNNEENIRNRCLDDIFFPRYFFGLFIFELLQTAIRENTDLVKIELAAEEITDVTLSERSGRLEAKSRKNFAAEKLVLAIGSVPKKRPFLISDEALMSTRYISD